ncbi:hypothetical protein Cenrod_2426 [Candidatus Symbiobacter mobilis CR]|uniref:Uncharacterized protein n=1 Tax=Candidatus Symbiobacter mobilis CR TaxID=946483 RepID=U5NE35_9BURK|nr:hypothetical protein Cenrod_2426 [Candidatus Symbiobacter mobilis CR]
MLADIIFAVVAPLLHSLFRDCFGFYTLAAVRGLCVACATCLAPLSNRVGNGF